MMGFDSKKKVPVKEYITIVVAFVKKMLNGEYVSKQEWHDLYSDMTEFSWWRPKDAPILLRRISEVVSEYIIGQKATLTNDTDSAVFLASGIKMWRHYSKVAEIMPLPFHTLEAEGGQGVKVSQDLPHGNPVHVLLLNCYYDNLFAAVFDKVLNAALGNVQAERDETQIDSSLVIGAKDWIVTLEGLLHDDGRLCELYHEYEAKYLSLLSDFLRREAAEEFAKGVYLYLEYAKKRIELEDARCLQYTDAERTRERVHDVCNDELVRQYQTYILDVVAELIQNRRLALLNCVFWFFDRGLPSAKKALVQVLHDYIVRTGLDEMRENAATIANNAEKFVHQLTLLYERNTQLIHEALCSDQAFLTARDRAFEILVNDTTVFSLVLTGAADKIGGRATSIESQCPQMIANYCDSLLRKTVTTKTMSSSDIEKALGNALTLLKYVSNKDVFMRFQKAHLTRRLILDTSNDKDMEEAMVGWLRDVGMPAEYLSHMQQMFQDMKTSVDLNEDLKSSARMPQLLNVKILKSSAWQKVSEEVTCILPNEMDESCLTAVNSQYLAKHNGRLLRWNHALSSGVLTFETECGVYDLELTAFQMAVMFQFNSSSGSGLTMETLKMSTGMASGELRRTVFTLLAGKHRVLITPENVTKSSDLTDKCEVRLNMKFALSRGNNVQTRGKINMIGKLQLHSEQNLDEDADAILSLRRLRMQEAIVKIMKARREISAGSLELELIELLKNMFVPQKRLIKEQLEFLINDNYIKRDANDMNIFKYIS